MSDVAVINNHVRLTVTDSIGHGIDLALCQVRYHKTRGKPGARIVAFEAEPFSINHQYKRCLLLTAC